MGKYLSDMSQSEIELAAERYYDRMLDEYLSGWEREEPWERDDPNWEDIADVVDAQSWDWICATIREYIEGDGDFMIEVYEAGLLAEWVNPALKMDDPDEEWHEVDRVMEAQWQNNELMKAIYKWLPEEHLKKMCEQLLKNADTNGIRELYNKRHEDDDRGWEEE